MIIFRQPGANIIETVDRITALMPQLQAEIPAGMQLADGHGPHHDHPRFGARCGVHAAASRSALVILVVFVFLRDVRATFIPSVAVPVSLIGTFGVMYLCGYSLDNLSLMALTIATGFVVDDAIVVIENITRHLEQGMPPMQAALLGAQEIGFTVLSISVSLIAVFIPILLMGGIVGRLFREFAVTLSVAIVVSLVVSLTTTPMMCARLLKPHEQEKHGRLYRVSESVFDCDSQLLRSDAGLGAAAPADHAAGVRCAPIGFTVYLYVVVPKGFFPQQDTGRLTGHDPRRPGHLVSGDAEAAGAVRAASSARTRRWTT